MKHSNAWWRSSNTRPMADRQVDQLIGLAQGILADGIVNLAEAEMLQDWLRANQATENPYVSRLLDSRGASTQGQAYLTRTKLESYTTHS